MAIRLAGPRPMSHAGAGLSPRGRMEFTMLLRWMGRLWPFGRKTQGQPTGSAGNLPAGDGKPGTGSGQGNTTGDRPATSGPAPTDTREGNTQGTGNGPAAPGISNSGPSRSQLRSQLLTQSSRQDLRPSPYHRGPPPSLRRPPPPSSSIPNRSADDDIGFSAGLAVGLMAAGNNAAAAAAIAPVVDCNGSSDSGGSGSLGGSSGGTSDSCASDPTPGFSGGGGDSGGAGATGSFDSGSGS